MELLLECISFSFFFFIFRTEKQKTDKFLDVWFPRQDACFMEQIPHLVL